MLTLSAVALLGWELRMRSLTLSTADIDDGNAHWARERRKVDTGRSDQVVIVGDSRILLDTSLDEWLAVSGVRPVQLAVFGTSAGTMLRDLAQDPHFTGLVVAGISEAIFFADSSDRVPPPIAYWRRESPSQRVGLLLQLRLSRSFAFLDSYYTPFALLETAHLSQRAGLMRPAFVKISEAYAARQTVMWPRLENDPDYQEEARAVWRSLFLQQDSSQVRPLPAFMYQHVLAAAVRDVSLIRSRGGEVVFVLPPYAGPLVEVGRRLTPRAMMWDQLLRQTGSFGVHYADYPQMQHYTLPEWSHLTAASARDFTRAYVTVLCERVAWLRTRAPKCAAQSR